MVLGITFGFAAATSNSLAYLFSRAFLQKHHQSYFHLLTVSHILMGVVSVILAAFLWPDNMLEFKIYGPSLLGTALFYFVAQGCLFLALKRTEASRLSPMLGSKIILLAMISVLFLGQTFTLFQWMAICFSFLAAVLLTSAGSRTPKIAILWISMTCLGYCLSDINIVKLVAHFETDMGLIQASLFSTALCYIVCGILSIIMLFILRHTTPAMWKDAIPFSILWYMAMLFLFVCFGSIGAVHGNIIQSTRGIISVVLAAFVSLMGFHRIEQKVTRRVFVKRICAAALMTAAVTIFHLNTG